jgi:arylsulfatase A-like enzyme
MNNSDDQNSNLRELAEIGPAADAAAPAEPAKASNFYSRISRRRLLQLGAGAGIAATLSRMPRVSTARAFASDTADVPNTPNIVVLMTDQERHHMHWPSGWAEKNLPGLQRLKRHGLYFNRAYTAVTQCSPSRALMMTGRFAPINRVTRTFLWPGLVHQNRQPNIASLLKAKASYEVVWKGKWHLSYASNAAIGNGGEDWTETDIKVMEENYGWSGWNPPDAGNAIERWQPTEFGKFNGGATLGGANPDNDGRYVNGRNAGAQTPGFGESVVAYLKDPARKLGKPFCLFVSLVNPHDVYVYPHFWKLAGYKRDAFVNLGIELPPNYADDLSTKPSVQKAAREAFNKFSPIETAQARNEYVNFYAYLNTVVDEHIMTVLDTLEETGLTDNTIVLRFADHGEGGLSHGMREKAYTAYEEMIHVPLIVHNPKVFPEPRETEAFYDHLDLLPTILDLAGVANAESYALGKSIVPVIKDPSTSVRDHTVFSFDDLFFLPANVPAGHIRAIREGDWTYAVYFGMEGGKTEYELYNIKSDPLQFDNLAHGTPSSEARKEWARLHRILTVSLIDASNLPDSFTWPLDPAKSQIL